MPCTQFVDPRRHFNSPHSRITFLKFKEKIRLDLRTETDYGMKQATFRCMIIVLFGLVCQDGMTWLLNSPQQNLPMILADNGFDVWIANTRGTRFCRKHVSLDSAQAVFFFPFLFFSSVIKMSEKT